MSSEPIVHYKRRAPDAPDTSDDDVSQPERGKEAEAAGPKLDQAERQRNKKLRRDGEARNLSREERKMTAIMRQIEEMEQKGRKLSMLVLASFSLRARSSMETTKCVRNVGLATRAMLGAREQDRGCVEREAGRGARSSLRWPQRPTKRLQAMRWVEHLRAQPPKKQLQAMQRAGHLRAQSYKEELQGLPAEGGLVLASRREQL